jgi:CelD/BcsL family acetyltransferase involved in cellulose biosynthesis
MDVELHVEGIDPLLAEWEALFAADSEATPFVSPGWAKAWSEHWAAGATPWTLAVRDEGRLVGLAPFVLRKQGPFRTLYELGNSPSRDLLAEPAARDECAGAVARELRERRGEWDAIVIHNHPGSSAFERAAEDAGLRSSREKPKAYPGIELPQSFEEYLAALPRKRRKDLRRHLRRLEEGPLALREVTDPGELPHVIERWRDLQVRWWDERNEDEDRAGRTSRYGDFVRDLTLALVPAGLATVWELHLDDAVVGVEISLLDRNTFYAWLGGYDPSIAHLGPGKVAIGHGIRTAIASGRGYYDLMRGAQSYKYWYGATDRYGQQVTLGGGAARSRLALAARAGAARLRRLRRGGGDSSQGAESND